MNLKALITTFVLGSSSLAMAKPVTTTFSAGAAISVGSWRPAVVVRDHRTPIAQSIDSYDCDDTTPVYYQGYRPIASNPHNTRVGKDISVYIGSQPFLNMRWFAKPAWLPLTEPTRIDAGRETINVGTQAGWLSSIRLLGNTGRTYLRMVGIEFVDGGRTEVVHVERDLVEGSSFTIDLTGRARQVKRVIVYGSTAPGSSYQLLGH